MPGPYRLDKIRINGEKERFLAQPGICLISIIEYP